MDNENCEVIEISTQDFVDMMIVKHNLLAHSVEELESFFSDKNSFLKLVNFCEFATKFENAFFLIDNKENYVKSTRNIGHGKSCGDTRYMIGKIYHILSKYRWNVSLDYQKKINELIIYFNQVDSLDFKKKYNDCLGYSGIQEGWRKTSFDSHDFTTLCNAIVYDAYLYNYLNSDDIIDDIPIFETEYVLSSLNYFMSNIPEKFDDELFLEKAINTITKLRKRSWFINFRVNNELDSMKSELSKINIKKS